MLTGSTSIQNGATSTVRWPLVVVGRGAIVRAHVTAPPGKRTMAPRGRTAAGAAGQREAGAGA